MRTEWDTDDQFNEMWFGEESQDVLARLAVEVAHLSGDIVEVGSWAGRSTVALAKAVDETVHAVDTWAGSPGEISAELAAERDVYAQFLANVEGLNVKPHRMGWEQYFDEHRDPVKFCFIDAEHTYENVTANIAAVRPLMVPGGIICGDDVHHQPVLQAVVEAFPAATAEATVWWYRFPATLEDRYDELCVTPSDIYLHLPRLVALVTELNAQHVIELGTRSGVSTVAFLHALEQTGGRLTSVDIDPGPDLESDRWQFIQGDDLDPAIVSTLEPADIVFIDTSHLYEQTVAELNVYRWLVKPGGRIVLHDTQLAHPMGAPHRPSFPVRTAVDEFCAAESFEWTEFTDCFGLAVIQVP